LQEVLNVFSADLNEGEKMVDKQLFLKAIEKIDPIETIIEQLQATAEIVRLKKKSTVMNSIAQFLEMWQGEDEGFARILEVKRLQQPFVSVSYRCLDPSLVSREVIEESYSTILMSGTLRPTSMYKDILGFSNATEATFENPFPRHNRLNVIVPTVTTRYSHRGREQYAKIAKASADIVNAVPGNSAVFFPSYDMRNDVYAYFDEWCEKKTVFEKPGMNKQEKAALLDEFSHEEKEGIVFMGVVGASFSEGIDLPGDLLKCVVVVGLPLSPPDLETQELIKYYDKKFAKGWDYAYTLPAITKTIQTAGRCIRSETDRGAIAYLDYRYALPHYKKCFPEDWDLEITEDYEDLIVDFFKNHQKTS